MAGNIDRRAGAWDHLRALPQYLLPHHALSRLMLRLTRVRTPWVKNLIIDRMRHHFRIDIRDAVQPDPYAYPSFNAFFTRALRPDARPLAGDDSTLISPVDGTVSQAGRIEVNRLLQAKGRRFTLETLLGGDTELARTFADGDFATLYLSPRDYHRIHMPLAGRLEKTLYVPGRLFSVAPYTVRSVPRLFARNERLVCLFDTPAGPMALILVGALFVACIETVWAGVVTPPHGHRIRTEPAPDSPPVQLARGAEMGRFNMGSTVILLFPPGRIDWTAELPPGRHLRMGEALGELRGAR